MKIDRARLAAILAISLAIIYFFLNLFSPASIPPFLRIAVSRRPVNILIVGTDTTYDSVTRKPIAGLEGRADTLLLARIDPLKYQIRTLSIPRDTYVNIPGYYPSKINAANVFGGIGLTQKVVSNLLKEKIDYYMEIRPGAIQKLVDGVGGIDIEIEENMRYVDHAQHLDINLKKGKRHLSGEEAHEYIRFRDEFGDIGRIERHQKFMKALGRALLRPSNIVRAPFAIASLLGEIKTNLPLSELIRLANLMRFVGMGNIKSVMIPGEPAMMTGVGSVWLVNQAELDSILKSSF